MESNDSKIIELAAYFLQRERFHQAISQKVIDMIQPTVFQALSVFLNVKQDAITWVAIDLESGLLRLTMIVTYGKNDVVPSRIEILSPTPHDEEDDDVQRILKVTLPVTMVFGEIQPMIDYMNQSLTEHIEEIYGEQLVDQVEAIDNNEPQFDVDLPKHQQQMLSLFNNTKGTKH